MTLRVTGVEAPKIKVAGVDAKRVMVGTGLTAVEAWPGTYDILMDFDFPTQDQLKWAPITGFDSRTNSNSQLTPGFVFNDMFVAGDNSSTTYNTRLVDHEADLLPLKFIVTLGDGLSTVARPSYVILAANLLMTHMLVAEFGSDGFRVFSLVNGALYPGTPYRYSQTYSTGDQLIIELQSDRVNVGKIGGSQTGYVSPTMIEMVRTGAGRMFFGFGVYSASGQWSSRIQRIEITGKTTQQRVLAASEALARITVPSNSWTEVARSTVPTGGTTTIKLIGAKWPQASSSNDRKFRIKVDGVIKATTVDEGGSLTLSSVPLLTNSAVTVEALAETTNSGYREVSGGVLQIGDPALFV